LSAPLTTDAGRLDEYVCALTSEKKSLGKKKVEEETMGEVYYAKQSIFNASVMEEGTVTLHHLSPWIMNRKSHYESPYCKLP